jgi:hypothetical protein
LYGQKAVDDLVRGWLQTWEKDIADRDALQAERDALLDKLKSVSQDEK